MKAFFLPPALLAIAMTVPAYSADSQEAFARPQSEVGRTFYANHIITHFIYGITILDSTKADLVITANEFREQLAKRNFRAGTAGVHFLNLFPNHASPDYVLAKDALYEFHTGFKLTYETRPIRPLRAAQLMFEDLLVLISFQEAIARFASRSQFGAQNTLNLNSAVESLIVTLNEETKATLDRVPYPELRWEIETSYENALAKITRAPLNAREPMSFRDSLKDFLSTQFESIRARIASSSMRKRRCENLFKPSP